MLKFGPESLIVHGCAPMLQYLVHSNGKQLLLIQRC